MGFAVEDGPEIEDEWHCFDALNTPANHPARDMQDTLYIDPQAMPPDPEAQSLFAADAYVARANPHDDEGETADPHRRAGPRLFVTR